MTRQEITMLEALREQHEYTKKLILEYIRKLDEKAKAENRVLTADNIIYLLSDI